jgi:ATP-binding cassette subfamily B (MDR/TAP) protein 1
VGITVALDAKLEAKILKIYGKAGGLAEEAMSTIRIVTAFDAKNKLSRKYDAYLETAKRYGVKKGPVLGFQYSTEFFAMYCAYALAWFYGIKLLLQGEVATGGDILTVLFSVLIGTSSITMIAPSMGDLTKAAAAAEGMFEMIDRKSLIDPMSEEGKRPEQATGNISLRNVTFCYPSRPTVRVLDDFSVDFEAGKVTAIVGASGSGKSTIVGLITRWFDPESGSILFDGADIKDLNVRWLRRNMGFVQQVS